MGQFGHQFDTAMVTKLRLIADPCQAFGTYRVQISFVQCEVRVTIRAFRGIGFTRPATSAAAAPSQPTEERLEAHGDTDSESRVAMA